MEMRAAGFASTRINMACPSTALGIPSYTKFGRAHFIDEYMREYRIMSSLYESLPLHELQMAVRIPKRKQRFSNGRGEICSMFPRTGERLTVTMAPYLKKLVNLKKPITQGQLCSMSSLVCYPYS